jgi:RimJ/RimL family protein N-acetyltransferase
LKERIILSMESRETEILHRFFQSRSDSRAAHTLLRFPDAVGFCDNWQEPRVAVVAWKDHVILAGDSNADGWIQFIASLDFRGFIRAPEDFLPGLKQLAPDLATWPRISFILKDSLRQVSYPRNTEIREVRPGDAATLEQIGQSWVWQYWKDIHDFCRTATACVADVGNRAVSVVSVFSEYENQADLAVATHPSFRRKGLATAAAHALCTQLVAQGKIPIWSTSPDNIASATIPRRLGFTEIPAQPMYVMNREIPSST